MDNDKRKIFWDTLCSLDGKNVKLDYEKLSKCIEMPLYLYRYRSLNSLDNLEHILQNTIKFSSAEHYDDPIDTFISIDSTKIAHFTNPLTSEEMREHIRRIGEENKSAIDEGGIDFLLNNNFEIPRDILKETLDNQFRNIRQELKKEIWSLCFSDDSLNESLWIKYADQHKGCVLEYKWDMSNLDCLHRKTCKTCLLNTTYPLLYPIYYSPKSYDATEFALYKLHMFATSDLPDQTTFVNSPLRKWSDKWEKERISLIKKKCHEYDSEWRMLLPTCQIRPEIMLKPFSIILGLHTPIEYKLSVILLSHSFDIKHIYHTCITDNGNLAKELIYSR